MGVQATAEELTEFFDTVLPHLDERQRRVAVGAMAESLGRGGQSRVIEASGMSSHTVWKAANEVRSGVEPSDRVRAPGAGDKPAIDKQPGLLEALDELVHPETRGSPMSALRWTLKSTYELARELTGQGFKVSAELVRRLLHQMGYSLQAPAKKIAGASSAEQTHPAQKTVAADGVPAGKQGVAAEKARDKKAGADAGDAANGEKRKTHVITLTLNAFVIKRGIRLKPARLVLGTVKRDARVVRKVRAEIVTRFVAARVTKVCCSAPWIHASVKEVPVEKDERRAIAKVRAYELVVTLDAARAPHGRSVLEFVTLYTSAVRWPFADLPIKARLEK